MEVVFFVNSFKDHLDLTSPASIKSKEWYNYNKNNVIIVMLLCFYLEF